MKYKKHLFYKALRGCWFFFWGHFFSMLLYDKKYLRGRWFQGKLNGICAQGWVWVTKDAIARIILRENIESPFPVSHRITIICPHNIEFHPDDLNNFQSFGIYYQAFGSIKIGKGTYIAPNVGLITSNHDIKNLDNHMPPQKIILGEKCWVGMNSVTLGGVVLGENTIVGAGSVVTKSFPEGHCIIAGNPAKKLRNIE